MHRCSLLLFILFLSLSGTAQHYRISGKIANRKLEPLALASIRVKGTQFGTVSRENGSYELRLEEGKYDLVVTMVGFKPQVFSLAVVKDYVQNVILEEEETNLEEAIVKTKLKDRSEEYIRNVIRHKEQILAAAGDYSGTAYIKAVEEDSTAPKLKKNKSIPDSVLAKKINTELLRMSMAEISLNYDRTSNSRIKEERTGVVKRGNIQSLFFLSLTEGDLNLYNNLLRVPSVSPVPFMSPISNGGLASYKYKLIATTFQGARKIYTISVRPRELSNVTVEGELKIMDSAWVILEARFRLPSYHMPEYDFLEVSQHYSFIQDKAWMIDRQEFIYYSKHGKGKLNGRTLVSYPSFELDKKFPPRHFGTELSAATQEAYDRDSSFWQKVRTEPLTDKELRFIRYKDSVFRATHNKFYLDSIDRITNKVTWKKLLLDGTSFYNREKGRTIYMPSVLSVFQPLQFGGPRIKLGTYYSKLYKSRKFLSIWSDISYGFRNHDINGNIRLTKMYNPFNRAFYRLEAGRDFQFIFAGDAWINMLKRSNLYLNNAIGAGHGQEIANGLFLNVDMDLALRRSLSNYKTGSDLDSIFNNWLSNNQALAFEPYNAAYGKIKLSYTPRQRYIREPREKIILGSAWPTFYVQWRKGIPDFLDSKINFDYLEFGLEQELKMGTIGIAKYSIRSGSFLNSKDLRVVDYKFQRRGDPIFFLNPNEAFQSLDSSFALFKRFYQGHYVHEFNGAIVNKIPFFKKLLIKEVAGGGFLIAPEKNLKYFELFAGIERAFKWPFDQLSKFKIGVYIVSSVANRNANPIEFKIGITSWDKTRNKWY